MKSLYIHMHAIVIVYIVNVVKQIPRYRGNGTFTRGRWRQASDARWLLYTLEEVSYVAQRLSIHGQKYFIHGK